MTFAPGPNVEQIGLVEPYEAIRMAQRLKDQRTKPVQPARSVLALADPPEAGWRLTTRSNAEATADAEMLAVPAYVPTDCLEAAGLSE